MYIIVANYYVMGEEKDTPLMPMESMPPPFSILNQNNPISVIYANGFAIGTSLSDLFVLMAVNGRATHQLHMSLGTAKTLMIALQTAIDQFEKSSGAPVVDVTEMQKIVEENKKKGNV